jgi:SAM-dependent methyltransferase
MIPSRAAVGGAVLAHPAYRDRDHAMDSKTIPHPNAEMHEYWNGLAGEKWVRLERRLDEGLQPFADGLFAAARLRTGERVLDVGCGCGATTLEAAKRVAPHGRATGIDISAIMTTRARERARELGLENVSFELIDAQSDPLPLSVFDSIISRFGVMFFSDPESAFRNLLSAARPGGRMTFVCWQKIDANPWMLLPTLAAMQHVTVKRPADPGAPGPFAFGDADRVRGFMERAGWRSVCASRFEIPFASGGGGSLDEAVDFMMEMGPAAQALREADAHTRTRVRQSIYETMKPYERNGGVLMDAAAWIFNAQRERLA